jgi:hypothetical protein
VELFVIPPLAVIAPVNEAVPICVKLTVFVKSFGKNQFNLA